MAKADGEIEDADLDKEKNSDEEEEDEEEEEDGESKGSKDSDEEEEESEDDEDDDESDSDDDDKKPLTRGDLKKFFAEQAKARGAKNRSAADKRNSEKGRDTKGARRDADADKRLSQIEEGQKALVQIEEKRQFGYANGLTPDEVDVVFRLTKRPTAKALRDPIIKGALEGYRSAKRAEANTPSTRARPARGSARDEKALTPAEKQERFADRRREILEGKRR